MAAPGWSARTVMLPGAWARAAGPTSAAAVISGTRTASLASLVLGFIAACLHRRPVPPPVSPRDARGSLALQRLTDERDIVGGERPAGGLGVDLHLHGVLEAGDDAGVGRLR